MIGIYCKGKRQKNMTEYCNKRIFAHKIGKRNFRTKRKKNFADGIKRDMKLETSCCDAIMRNDLNIDKIFTAVLIRRTNAKAQTRSWSVTPSRRTSYSGRGFCGVLLIDRRTITILVCIGLLPTECQAGAPILAYFVWLSIKQKTHIH